MLKEKLYHIKTDDNVYIALWKFYGEKNIDKHILMTHGTFSSRKAYDGLASYFVEKGFTCWVMEWRNHGDSPPTEKNFNLETIAKYDLKATLDFLITEKAIQQLHCIAHSGGGIAITMCLIQYPHFRENIDSISLFAVQAFAAGVNPFNRFKIFLSKYFSALLGYVPAKMAGSNENNETYYTMKQWFNWNIRANFLGDDGFDYKSRMNEIQVPILSICGKKDNFIAPKRSCEIFVDTFENEQNKLLYFSMANGNLEDYNHGRILKSRNSQQEIWPIVADWISKHSTKE